MQISRGQMEAKLAELIKRGGPFTDQDKAEHIRQDLFPQHRIPRILELQSWFIGVEIAEIVPKEGEIDLRWHELRRLTEQLHSTPGTPVKLGLE